MKRCSRCLETKPFEAFFKDVSRHDNLTHACKACRRKSREPYIRRNRDALLQKMAEYRKANRKYMSDMSARWAAENREKVVAYAVAWRDKNRAHHNAYKARRRAEKTQATPKWADLGVIREFYEEAGHLGLQIDHIVPLKSPLVCGLHCEANLQAIPARDNLRKFNRHWPDMP